MKQRKIGESSVQAYCLKNKKQKTKGYLSNVALLVS